MRIVVRDAEWLVKHVGAVHHEGGRIFTVLTCVGVSNLVSGRTSKFIVEYEERPELKQKIQQLEQDSRKARLRLRQSAALGDPCLPALLASH